MGWPDRVAVIGAGYMGQGIAEVLALAGCDCALADVSAQRAYAASEQLFTLATKHEADGLIPIDGAASVRSRVTPSPTAEEAARTADLIIEAVFEDRDLKVEVLQRATSTARPQAVVATNTSSISIESLAAEVEGPERFLGVHFFNPPQFVPGVEIIPGSRTSDDVADRVEALLIRAGKRPARVGDVPGFVANRLQYALFQEAAAVVEEGAATPEAVDAIVKSTFGFRLPFYGPFAIADMAGLDVYRGTYAVLERAYQERFVAPRSLLDLIDQGALGSKSGSGFVVSSPTQASAMAEQRDRSYAALERLLSANQQGTEDTGSIGTRTAPGGASVSKSSHQGRSTT